MKHVQDLSYDVDKAPHGRLVVKYGADHAKSFAMLLGSQPQAHAFVMDHVLLASARATDPDLAKAKLFLARWSPAPHAQECYGVMTRKQNAARLEAGGSDFSTVVANIMSDLRRSTRSGSRLLQNLRALVRTAVGPRPPQTGEPRGSQPEHACVTEALARVRVRNR